MTMMTKHSFPKPNIKFCFKCPSFCYGHYNLHMREFSRADIV